MLIKKICNIEKIMFIVSWLFQEEKSSVAEYFIYLIGFKKSIHWIFFQNNV